MLDEYALQDQYYHRYHFITYPSSKHQKVCSEKEKKRYREILFEVGAQRIRITWVRWDNICKTKEKGGLGIRTLKSLN